MLVSKRMRKEPVTVGPEDHLATVQKKMTEGGFRRTPVVENGRLPRRKNWEIFSRSVLGLFSIHRIRNHRAFSSSI